MRKKNPDRQEIRSGDQGIPSSFVTSLAGCHQEISHKKEACQRVMVLPVHRLLSLNHRRVEGYAGSWMRFLTPTEFLSLNGLAVVSSFLENRLPGSYQRLDLFIKVLRVLCPNVTAAPSSGGLSFDEVSSRILRSLPSHLICGYPEKTTPRIMSSLSNLSSTRPQT